MTKKRSRGARRTSQLWDVLGPLALIALLWRKRRAGQPAASEQPAKDEKRPGAHLVPDQLTLIVRHSGPLTAADIDTLIKTTPALERLRALDPRVPFEQVSTFGRGAAAFSMVPVRVSRQANDQQMLRLVLQLDEQIKLYGTDNAPPDPQQSRSADTTDTTDTAGTVDDAAPARVARATPNWTAGAAIERNGSGSPGARPTPLQGPPEPTQQLKAWQSALIKVLDDSGIEHSRNPGELGDGVDVYILDTAPDEIDMQRAARQWASDPLMQTLFAPKRLEMHYAGGTHLLQQVDFYHDNANYVMSDHGLFVASIIHALAPRAKLHLVEVLNPYGVGSLVSIAHGFSVAAVAVAANPGGKLIVNASLGFEVAPPVPEWLERVQKADPFWAALDADGIKDLMQPLEDICELFADVQPEGRAEPRPAALRVVAAAGNDNTHGNKPQPPARYPAAFNAVLGVGALDHTKAITDYSNQADNPPGDGIRIFGGERIDDPTNPRHGQADPTFGIPGIYIGAFPDGAPNRTGWARWAGTSFATPLITGAIAVLMSGGMSFRDAQDFLKSHPFWP